MPDSIRHMLSGEGFMPHGMCYLWRADVLSLHVVSDALIALAYFSIPFTLLYFVRKRKDLKFRWMFWCFALFILACGTTHLMDILVIWYPIYWVSGSIKAITALASVTTAILLVRLVPHAVRLPSPLALEQANANLRREVDERIRAQSEVQRVNDTLEQRVAERTEQLAAVNRELRQEIRERKSVEQGLRDTETRLAQLAAIVESSDDAIMAKTLGGIVTSCNRAAERLFGYPAAEIVGRPMLLVFPEDRVGEEADILAKIARGESLDHFETTRLRKDGTPIDVSVSISPIKDARGEIVGASTIARDISERKRVERKQHMQLARLELLSLITRAIGQRQDLPSIFQVVIRSLEDNLSIDFGCVCLYDSTAEELTVSCVGAASELLAFELGLPDRACIAVDENGLSRCVRGELVYEPDIAEVQFSFPQRLAKGALRALVAAPLLVESKVFGVLIAARRTAHSFSSGECEFLRQLSEHVALAAHQAVTHTALQRAYDDLRQTQEAVLQQERLRALGQMASGIAHDINNAISPVMLFTDSLLEREPSLSARGREHLQIIQRAIEDVAHSVTRMGEFYRPRAPQPMLVPLQLNQLVDHVIDLTRARWSDIPQQRGVVIEIRRELAAELPTVMGAEGEVREALTNLVFNAVDAMPNGGVLTIRTNASNARVDVEVSDTGIGMDEDTRRRCLEPFFTTKGERGSGLGLAMVYGMVERHSAEIDIRSTVGVGTTIRLSFPRTPAPAPLSKALLGTPPVLPRLRILIVDDDPLLRKSLGVILEAEGHQVTAADGGQAGIDAFGAARQRDASFDLVISDLGMPHVDGSKVAAAIKRLSPSTPVILLTGWGQRLIAEAKVPPHVDHVLSKPPKLNQLREAIARCLMPDRL